MNASNVRKYINKDNGRIYIYIQQFEENFLPALFN